MDDDMHLYDVAGYQGGGLRLRDETEKVTCFDDKDEYMSLHDLQQEGSNVYQDPQWCARNTRATVTNDDSEVIGPLHSHVQKEELKQMKRRLCALSLLVAILFLMTVSSLGLAAYGFYSTGSSASSSQIQKAGNTELVSNHSFTSFKEQLAQQTIQIWENISDVSVSLSNMVVRLVNVTNQEIHQLITTLDTHINDTNMQIVSLISLQSAVNMIESRMNITSGEVDSLTSLRATVNTLESQLTTTNAEIVSQRTFVNNLESRFNTTNAEVISQRSSLNTLNSQLNTIDSEVSTLPSVRSSVTNLQSQLSTFFNNANISSLQIALRSQPLIRLSRITLRVSASTLTVTFAKLDSVTFNREGSTTTISSSSNVTISNGNNILAYYPNYQDTFRSNLATIFIHVEAVYPCATQHDHISCKLLPNEDDGFRGGRAILESMDNAGNFRVFSGTTYAFALQGCSQINSTCCSSSVLLEFILMCLVPSSVCS